MWRKEGGFFMLLVWQDGSLIRSEVVSKGSGLASVLLLHYLAIRRYYEQGW